VRNPRRSLATGAVLIGAVLSFLIYQGISNNLVYYSTPTEMLHHHPVQGESFRLGGQVKPGSVNFNFNSHVLRFVLQDTKSAIRVISHGTPPQMFRAGAGAVVEGTYQSGIFSATNLMVKHGNDYRAPKPGQTPLPDNYSSKASP